MPERPKPDLDQTREMLRRLDARPDAEPAEEPPPPPDEDERDEEEPGNA
jgi:hypothetical protein